MFVEALAMVVSKSDLLAGTVNSVLWPAKYLFVGEMMPQMLCFDSTGL